MSEDGYIFIAAWAVAAVYTLGSAAKNKLPPSTGILCALGIPLILMLLAVLPWWLVLFGFPLVVFAANLWKPVPKIPKHPKITYLS